MVTEQTCSVQPRAQPSDPRDDGRDLAVFARVLHDARGERDQRVHDDESRMERGDRRAHLVDTILTEGAQIEDENVVGVGAELGEAADHISYILLSTPEHDALLTRAVEKGHPIRHGRRAHSQERRLPELLTRGEERRATLVREAREYGNGRGEERRIFLQRAKTAVGQLWRGLRGDRLWGGRGLVNRE